MNSDLPTPPSHLSDEAGAFWSQVVADYQMEPHHLRLLQVACEAWDRGQLARAELAAHGGVTFKSASGDLKTHPAVSVQRDAAILFNRTVRELALDAIAAPEAPRPVQLADYRR